jgi:hypothetical protein
MINWNWTLVLLYLLLPIVAVYAILSIAIDARAIRRILERQEASRPGVGP